MGNSDWLHSPPCGKRILSRVWYVGVKDFTGDDMRQELFIKAPLYPVVEEQTKLNRKLKVRSSQGFTETFECFIKTGL